MIEAIQLQRDKESETLTVKRPIAAPKQAREEGQGEEGAAAAAVAPAVADLSCQQHG